MTNRKASIHTSRGAGTAEVLIGLAGVALAAWFYVIAPAAESKKSQAAQEAQQSAFVEKVQQYMAAESPPRGPATIKTIGESIKGVKSSVEVLPGKTPEHGIEVTVRYEVPTDERICIGMTAYESISMGGGWPGHYHGDPAANSGCIDKAPEGKAYLSVNVHRNDIPSGGTGLMGSMVDPEREKAKALRPDGFILVNLKIGDKYQLQRIESPYFTKAVIKTVEK